jgi:hypothetical protein
MDIAIIRLVNNDRVVGFVIDSNDNEVALYAPMSIDKSYGLENDDPKGYYVYSPYDPLSDTCMVVFDMSHVLTLTRPREVVEQYYESAWNKYYPAYEEFQRSVVKAYQKQYEDMEDSSFNSDILSEMFSEFLSKDKKKLN